jgi:fucose permease
VRWSACREVSPLSSRPARADAAKVAVAVVFGVNGFSMATWASRLPAIRSDLGLTTQRLGFVLLTLSVGSVLMLTLSGAFVRRFGPARTVAGSVVVSMLGLAVIGLAPSVGALAAGLALLGAGIGSWDVAMNVEGAEVERRLQRSIMSRFHAAFSLGTIAGAGVGALAATVDLPLRVHLPGVALIVLVGALVAVRSFLVPPDGSAEERPAAAGGLLAAWTEPRTLLIGVMVFSMALAEGSANDWVALSLVDGYGSSDAVGAVGLGVFVTGMTAMRMAGPWLLDRYDPVRVVRGSALLVLAGTGLLVLGAYAADGDGGPALLAVAALAALLWGLGAALGFPMGMSAASADPVNSAARVGVVSTVGYTAFIAGPPLLGTLGHAVGTAQSMLAVSVAVLLAVVTAGAVRTTPDAAAQR